MKYYKTNMQLDFVFLHNLTCILPSLLQSKLKLVSQFHLEEETVKSTNITSQFLENKMKFQFI